MWLLTDVRSDSELWFSDGGPIKAPRGGFGLSNRLIVGQREFLDLTDIGLSPLMAIDANGLTLSLSIKPDPERHHPPFPTTGGNNLPWLELSLAIEPGGRFTLRLVQLSDRIKDYRPSQSSVSGVLKPLPTVAQDDVYFISKMIKEKYVPYPQIPDAPGKTEDEIRALGKRLFPWAPFSFELAICLYDWTTASFARMVFLKIFEYTDIPQSPFPIDRSSISQQIWKSNWPPYTPSDPDYMRSFMMKPASSLEHVEKQMSNVSHALHEFSNVENRLISAAVQALPRTSLFSKPRLFSGQVDIYQLGLEHFGIEFLQCPLNKGPVDQTLVFPLADAMADYISVGKTVTTKMVWSFTDSVEKAMHYANGILLVANSPGNSFVWDSLAYVTDLSDDPKKTEYMFTPGTRFKVQSVEQAKVCGEAVVVIHMEPEPARQQPFVHAGIASRAQVELSNRLGAEEAISLPLEKHPEPTVLPHTPGKTAGRRCACHR